MPQRVPGRGVTAAVTLPARGDALAWAGDGAAHLRGLMTRMGDGAFRKPSLLPGWTRAHVLTHVARNADVMIDVLTRARSGEPVPVRTGREHGSTGIDAGADAGVDADIEAGASRSPAEIRADVFDSSDRLADAVRVMPDAAWSAVVETPRGVRVPADAVPWGRAREVWIHAVDLDVGASFADMPAPMLTVLVAEVAADLGVRPGCPRVLLEDADTGRTVAFGPGPEPGPETPGGPDVARGTGGPGGSGDRSPDPVTVRGPAHALAAWLLGRTIGTGLRTSGGGRPGPLPTWR